MGRKLIDLTGKKIGRWTVIELATREPYRSWKCICECGSSKVVNGAHLRSGQSQSCGCLIREITSKRVKTHGMTRTPTYESWRSMLSRCDNKSSGNYHYYGGIGINYDPSWSDFSVFLEDMGIRPEGTSLDRIDNSMGYSKDNCRWATPLEQASNKRNCMQLTHNGVTKTSAAWSKDLGMSKSAVYTRVRNGWDVSMAVTTPKR